MYGQKCQQPNKLIWKKLFTDQVYEDFLFMACTFSYILFFNSNDVYFLNRLSSKREPHNLFK